jgi:hypothetical membrane protein
MENWRLFFLMRLKMERKYTYGVTLVIIGGVFLSLSGILLRNIESYYSNIAAAFLVLFALLVDPVFGPR